MKEQELVKRDPLTKKEALMVLERTIDILYDLEDQTSKKPVAEEDEEENEEALRAW